MKIDEIYDCCGQEPYMKIIRQDHNVTGHRWDVEIKCDECGWKIGTWCLYREFKEFSKTDILINKVVRMFNDGATKKEGGVDE